LIRVEKLIQQTIESNLKVFQAMKFSNCMILTVSDDLTRIIAEEKGLTIDEAGFEARKKEQQDRSKADSAQKFTTG
jgi:alanyl-tRNA synthetase